MWSAVDVETWVSRRTSRLDAVHGPVQEIIEKVRSGGDAALIEPSRKFDKVDLDTIAVDEDTREAAYEQVDAQVTECLVEAEVRISRFHELQPPRGLWLSELEPGITLGVKTTPLSRVGAYVPGGRAAYPSTALMCTVPARIAGVPRSAAAPPRRSSRSRSSRSILPVYRRSTSAGVRRRLPQWPSGQRPSTRWIRS